MQALRLGSRETSPHIFPVSDRLQVGGADTAAIAAEMIELKTIRNGTNEHCVHETMGKNPSARRVDPPIPIM